MNKFILALSISILGFSVFGVTEAEAKPTPYDAKFLDQFSEHHKDAIKMGEMALSKAESPEVKKMAKKMVSDQKEEVVQMAKWREQFFSSAPKSKSEMPKMDMTGLKSKSGKDFDLAFLDMMTKHHEHGISMAKGASDKLFNPQIKTFAQNAVMNQDRERQELDAMKKSEASHSGTTHE